MELKNKYGGSAPGGGGPVGGSAPAVGSDGRGQAKRHTPGGLVCPLRLWSWLRDTRAVPVLTDADEGYFEIVSCGALEV